MEILKTGCCKEVAVVERQPFVIEKKKVRQLLIKNFYCINFLGGVAFYGRGVFRAWRLINQHLPNASIQETLSEFTHV